MFKKTLVCFIWVLSVLAFNTAYAAITISEDFQYPDDTGPLANKDGGQGWGGPWTVTGAPDCIYGGNPNAPSGGKWGRYAAATTVNTYLKRDFQYGVNNITTFTFQTMSDKMDLPSTCNMSFIGNDDKTVISIGYVNNGSLYLAAFKDAAMFETLASGDAVPWGEYEFTSITVDFVNHQYDVTVKIFGGTPTTIGSIPFFDGNVTSSSLKGLKIEAAIAGTSQPYFWVDNIEISGDAAVPEPSSVAFFGIGLLGLVGAGWRKVRKQ